MQRALLPLAKDKRHFKRTWEEEYFFTDINSKAVCLICSQSVAVLKEYNIRRHYETRHAAFSRFKGEARKTKSRELLAKLRSQQNTLTRPSSAQESATQASYEISALIARSGRSFSTGDFVKTLRSNSKQRLVRTFRTQLSFWFSYGVSTLRGTTKSEDLFAAVERVLDKNGLRWEKMAEITTDGAPAMIGRKAGLTTLVSQKVAQCGGKVAQYHCILHQEQLCAKSIGLGDVYNIRRHYETRHAAFSRFKGKARKTKSRELLAKLRSHDPRQPRKVQHRPAMRFQPELSPRSASQLIITEMFDHITAFQRKLQLLCRHLSAGNLAHFPSLREVNLVQQKLSEYATLVSNLDLEFEMRFQDFRKNSGDMELFSQPFSTSVDCVPDHIQMELIEFQCDSELRNKFMSLKLDGRLTEKMKPLLSFICMLAAAALLCFNYNQSCQVG
uniref:SPIN-DOC-like zinc-finger domain-containing protein n=1 Tax=Monopterus albus TaxID=43700 RepID=A0A3Q3QF24_MONAL